MNAPAGPPAVPASKRPLPLPRQSPAGPGWRALGVLALLVFAAHTLVLRSTPGRVGPELAAPVPPAPTFATRRISAPPVPAPAPLAAALAPQAAAKPARKPVFKPKQPPAQSAPRLIAIDSGANKPEETPPNPDTLAPPDSAPASPTADDTAAPASSPASAPAASAAPPTPPSGPQVTPVTAMALPGSAQLAYTVTGGAKGLTYHASAELNWRNMGNAYDARMTVSALFLGSRSMSSTGQITPQGLAPTRFSDKSRSEVAAHFEPDKQQITFSANTPSVPWVEGTQDRASIFLQLGGMLAGNPAGFPVGTSLLMYTVGPRDADSWTFLVEGEESLTLPFGTLATLKLTRQPRREFDQKVEIWYAPSLGYLPVRNKITQANGDFVDQQLSAVSQP